VIDAYLLIKGLYFIIDSFMRTEKEGEKDCRNASMLQVFRSIATHHYRNIQPIFLYDGDDMQVCLREKKKISLSTSKKKGVGFYLYVRTKKRIYPYLSLFKQKKASASISMREQKK